jgi:tetratricopeptide (TPR) repeat protein
MPRACFLTAILILFPAFSAFAAFGQELKDAEQAQRSASAYYEAGEYEKAIEAYKRALQLSPNSEAAYYHLGMAYSSLGRYDEAVGVYNRAIRIKPDYASAHFNLGHAYSNLKHYDKAIRAFRQAIQYEPDNTEAYLALGRAYLDSGKEDKAVDAFETAIRRNPENPYAYYNLGLLYFPAGYHSSALEAFTQAITRDPRYADAYFHRAYSYLFLGRGESAASDAETYLALKGWRDEYSLDLAIVAHFGHLLARHEDAAHKILQEASRQGNREVWPYPIVEYLLGDISAHLLFKSAADVAEQVEARTYIGLDLSFRNESKDALKYLRWVKDHSKFESITYALAVSEIARIEASSAVLNKK